MVKTEIEQFIQSWVVCVAGPADLKLELAIETILKTIDSYLQQHKEKSGFQDLIQFALQTAQALPRTLRFKTLSYLRGDIQREVERSEYQQLKNCFRKHLEPLSWSSYGVFIAAEVLPPLLLILTIASMPGLAVAAQRSTSTSSEGVAPPCTHLLKIDYAKSNLMLQEVKLQLSKMGVDYNKLPLQADFSVEKIRHHADCFARTLMQFANGQLGASHAKNLLHTVLNEDAYMEPLYLILTYSQNEPLRCKIIARLAQRLYSDIQQRNGANVPRLIRILGQAMMTMQPDKLPPSITKDEIIRMADMLSLYKRIAQSESAVNKQSLALRAVSEMERSIAPQPMPAKEHSYYAPFLVLFAALMGLVHLFMRFFNSTLPTPKVNIEKITMPERINEVKMPLSSQPTAIKLLSPIMPLQTGVKEIPVQADLQAILAKLNDLFLDLIIPDPDPLRWRKFNGAQAYLELRLEQYYYDTQGKGSVFRLSKNALSVLVKEYCNHELEAKEIMIQANEGGLVLEQLSALNFNKKRSIKQYYSAFFKILRQSANVYYPIDVQLDYESEEFLVVFSLNEEADSKSKSYSLVAEQFLQHVDRRLNLNGQETQFSIPYTTIKAMPAPNGKEFFATKREACTKKEKEFMGQPAFFNPREAHNDSQKNSALMPLKIGKNR